MAWVSDPFTGAGAWRCRPSPRPFSALVFGWVTQRPFGTSPQAGRTNREAAFPPKVCLRPGGRTGQGGRRSTLRQQQPMTKTRAQDQATACRIVSSGRHPARRQNLRLQAAAASRVGAAELPPVSELRIPESAPRASSSVASRTSKVGMNWVGTVLRPTSTATCGTTPCR